MGARRCTSTLYDVELTYRFSSAAVLHTITFYGVGSHAGGVSSVVDNVRIVPCTVLPTSANRTITVPAAVSGRSLTAHWAAADDESGIEDSFWAIGTTPGGDQLQPFTSVGQAVVVEASHLSVEHGDSMYVTAVVRNGAGLSHVVGGSTSLGAVTLQAKTVVDWTPPEGRLFDGKAAVDADGHDSLVLSANLKNILDPESGIRSCSWSFGSTPGAADLSPWTEVLPDEADGTLPIVKTDGAIEPTGAGGDGKGDVDAMDGLLVYATARCVNNAGLLAIIHSDGAYLQLKPPVAARGAFVRVLSPPGDHTSQVPASLGHQTNADVVHIAWEGFAADARMVGHYEVRLVGPGLDGSSASEWVDTQVHQQARFGPGLDLQENVLYTAEVVMVNAAGVKAAAVKAGVWVDTTPPVAASKSERTKLFCATFDNKKGLTVGWASIFSESGCVGADGAAAAADRDDCLLYRYNVGTSAGAGNVVRWADSGSSGADAKALIRPRDLAKDRGTGLLDLAKDYYVTVAAYNLAGLGTAETFRVQAASKC